jgi:hypothetical protein
VIIFLWLYKRDDVCGDCNLFKKLFYVTNRTFHFWKSSTYTHTFCKRSTFSTWKEGLLAFRSLIFTQQTVGITLVQKFPRCAMRLLHFYIQTASKKKAFLLYICNSFVGTNVVLFYSQFFLLCFSRDGNFLKYGMYLY